jgi:hypothetical protein
MEIRKPHLYKKLSMGIILKILQVYPNNKKHPLWAFSLFFNCVLLAILYVMHSVSLCKTIRMRES